MKATKKKLIPYNPALSETITEQSVKDYDQMRVMLMILFRMIQQLLLEMERHRVTTRLILKQKEKQLYNQSIIKAKQLAHLLEQVEEYSLKNGRTTDGKKDTISVYDSLTNASNSCLQLLMRFYNAMQGEDEEVNKRAIQLESTLKLWGQGHQFYRPELIDRFVTK